MERITVSTLVYLPREEVFDFLVDFPRYARYSEYLERVEQDGDGGAGTRYRLRFAWWKLSYTAHSEVTAVERPDRIDWRILRHVDAEGRWRVEPADLPADAPGDAETASRVVFEVWFDPDSAAADAVDLPRLVSLDAVVDRVRPLVVEEAERIVERIVADLEGRRRPVDLTVERSE
ncbi:MAG: type II toxin-antitoxin system RatA family toxin [Haloferacaceae archaeon]